MLVEDDAVHLETGSEFAGYRILRRLDSGGPSAVYLAQDQRMESPVALKVMPSIAAHEAVMGLRFKAEMRLLCGLDHPAILTLHQVDVSDGIPWLTMQYIEGGNLRAGFEEAPLSWPDGIDVLSSVAAALDHLHQRGILYRELKPADIFRDQQGRGLLRLPQPRALLDSSGEFWHAPTAAPEHVQQRPLTTATDVYALGVIAFRWLAGAPLFVADDSLHLLLKHVAEAPSLDRLSHLPQRAAAAIERAIEKQPAARFQSPSEFIRELAAGLGVALKGATG